MFLRTVTLPWESAQPPGLLESHGGEEDSGAGRSVLEPERAVSPKAHVETGALLLLPSRLLEDEAVGGGRCVYLHFQVTVVPASRLSLISHHSPSRL